MLALKQLAIQLTADRSEMSLLVVGRQQLALGHSLVMEKLLQKCLTKVLASLLDGVIDEVQPWMLSAIE